MPRLHHADLADNKTSGGSTTAGPKGHTNGAQTVRRDMTTTRGHGYSYKKEKENGDGECGRPRRLAPDVGPSSWWEDKKGKDFRAKRRHRTDPEAKTKDQEKSESAKKMKNRVNKAE